MNKRRLALLGVLMSGSLSISLALLFRPFEVGPRHKGLPTSYWKNRVSDYVARKPLTLVGRLESYLGLRDKNGIPSVLENDPAALSVVLELVRTNDLVGLCVACNLDSFGTLSSLSKSNKDECLKAATGCVFSKNWNISAYASGFLRKHPGYAGPRTINRLINALQVEDKSLSEEDASVRILAIRLLGEIGQEAAPAIPSLSKLLTDTRCFLAPRNQGGPFRTVSAEAAEAMRHIDPEVAERAEVK